MDNPAAWHPDPTGRHEHRWWDGDRWTEHVADAGQSAVDPIDGDPSSGNDSGAPDDQTGAGTTSPDSSAGAAGDTWHTPAADAGDGGTGTSWSQPDPGSSGPQAPGTGAPTPPGGGAWGTPDTTGGGAAGWSGQGGVPGSPGSTPGGPAWQQPGWQQTSGATAPAKTPGLATTSLVLGILSIPLMCFFIVGLPLSILAIVLGFVGRNQAKTRNGTGQGIALSGIITGIVGLVLNVLALVLVGSYWGELMDYAECVDTNPSQQCEHLLPEIFQP